MIALQPCAETPRVHPTHRWFQINPDEPSASGHSNSPPSQSLSRRARRTGAGKRIAPKFSDSDVSEAEGAAVGERSANSDIEEQSYVPLPPRMTSSRSSRRQGMISESLAVRGILPCFDTLPDSCKNAIEPRRRLFLSVGYHHTHCRFNHGVPPSEPLLHPIRNMFIGHNGSDQVPPLGVCCADP